MTFFSSSPKIRFVALTAATSLLLASCGDSGEGSANNESDSLTQVRMGYVPWIGYGGWYLSESEGIFEDEDLDVELTTFNTDADKNNALAAGQIDALNIASHGALQMIEEGVDVSIVLLLDISTSADGIAVVGDIDSVSDLEGQSVAYEEVTTSDLLLNYALSEEGLGIEDIDPVPMAASDAGAALIGDQVPVAVTYEPYLSEARSADEDIDVIYEAGEAPGIISDVLIVRNDFLDENPDAVQSLVDSWAGAMDFYDANTETAQEIIAEYIGSDIDSLRTAFDGVEFYSGPDNADALTGEYVDEIMPIVEEASLITGIIEDTVDFESAINSEFVDESG